MTNKWTIENSKNLYSIEDWGEGHFTINSDGDLCLLPEKDKNEPIINLMEVMQEIKDQKISLPAVVRFHDILRSRVINLNETFIEVIKEAEYGGKYQGVYPIKVNQMREVVEEILDAGKPYDYGLEAGSKPELVAVLAFNDNPNALTILNGYKDEEYLRLALLGRKLGRKVIVVVEKFSELEALVKLSKEQNVKPLIGLRAKLSSKGSGKWSSSSGDKAKFGLSANELVNAVKYLQDVQLIDCLQLFHFHVGSQVTDIRTFKETITEGARIYCELVKKGAPIQYFDVGGGLGVDYQGSRSTENSSINYNLKEYAEDIVYILKQICDLSNVSHPNIVSESGRAITAHHSCLFVNVFGQVKELLHQQEVKLEENDNVLLKNMNELLQDITKEKLQETYHDAERFKDQTLSAFKLGMLTLEERGKIEVLYNKIIYKIITLAKEESDLFPEFDEVRSNISSQYLCNFSVFQSLPDTWAIDQYLPIVPLNRHKEEPSTLCTLADITCDSDGKISQFVSSMDDSRYLPLHPLKKDEPYYLGIFLTGAYQDVMGDMHNLFGKLNEVHIYCDDDDPTDFYIEEVIPGNRIAHVLKSMQYNPEILASMIKKVVDAKVKAGEIRPKEGVKLCDFYENCIAGYTYLK